MKRIYVVIALLILSTIFTLSATEQNPWIPTSLRLGTGNDTFSFSFGENHDDQLSFGEHFYIGSPLWFLTFDHLGYTNRAWQDNAGTPIYKGRYDQAQTRFGMHFYPVKNELFTLHLTPIIGYSAIGDIGGQRLQNLWHGLFNIPLLDLPYEDSVHSPELSLLTDISWEWQKGDVFVGAGIVMNFFNQILWQYEQQIFGTLFLGSEQDRIVEMRLGWSWFERHNDNNSTQKLVHRFFQGPRLELDYVVGAFFISRMHVFDRNFSYTEISFDFIKLFAEPKTWEKSTLFITPIAFDPLQSTYTFKCLAQIKDFPLRVYIEDRWGSGRTLVESSEKDNSFLTAGLQYDIPDEWSKQIFSPFVSIGAGVAKWGVFDKTPIPSWSGDNFVRDAAYSFILDIQAGFSLLPPNLLRFGNASYRLVATAGTHMIFNYKHVNGFYDETQRDRPDIYVPHIQFFNPHVTISLEVGLDV